jgi:tetratricopeptide (TPR) repeat protein
MAAYGCGLLALAVHNLVDFNLELLGLAVPAAAIAGALSSSATRSSRKGRPKTDPPGGGQPASAVNQALRLAPAVALAGLGMLVLVAASPTLEQDEQHLTSLARKKAALKAFREVAKQAIQRRPADYLPHLATARVALQNRSPEAMAWLNRALFLYPENPQIHLQTARALLGFGRRKQALGEIRMSLRAGVQTEALLKWALRFCSELEELDSMLPLDPDLRAMAARLLLDGDRPALAHALLENARRRWKEHQGLAEVHVDVMLKLGLTDRALALARRVDTDHPSPTSAHRWARAAWLAQGPQSAARIYETTRQRFPRALSLTRAHGRALLAAKRADRAEAIANQALEDAATARDRALGHRLLADIYRATGRQHRAAYEAEQVRRVRRGQ